VARAVKATSFITEVDSALTKIYGEASLDPGGTSAPNQIPLKK